MFSNNWFGNRFSVKINVFDLYFLIFRDGCQIDDCFDINNKIYFCVSNDKMELENLLLKAE